MPPPSEESVRAASQGSGVVTVRLWAGAAAAAGARTSREELTVEVADEVSVAWVQGEVVGRYAGRPGLGAVLDTCSVLVDDVPLGRRDRGSVGVRPGQSVEFLPPFAGG